MKRENYCLLHRAVSVSEAIWDDYDGEQLWWFWSLHNDENVNVDGNNQSTTRMHSDDDVGDDYDDGGGDVGEENDDDGD